LKLLEVIVTTKERHNADTNNHDLDFWVDDLIAKLRKTNPHKRAELLRLFEMIIAISA
jgi:hypothetical protein